MSVIDCVDFCRALGDATRQDLLRVLQQDGEQCVSDLVRRFGLSQPTISHHLALLKRSGLVTSRKQGKQVYYAIDQENVYECCGMLLAKFAPPGGPSVALAVASTGKQRPARPGRRGASARQGASMIPSAEE